ncbi:MAG: Type 1 glutamine amidotransferase-like domain-containing protein [Patescibacteria group bacterium]|nr:Type 1 glutamine amidotransferase-like domain-containing protein [Patescibacteria group bacterium]
MRKLFLSSIGLAPETNLDFFKLVGKEPSEIAIGFIPTASDVEENKSYVQMDLEDIKKIGMKSVIVDLKNENSLYEKLSKVDVIMVEGGNTFYLLDWARKSRFDKIIGKLLDEGKIYYGISAGSYITCPNIEAATWKPRDRNFIKLKDLTGLNLVPFILSAHFGEQFRKYIEQGAESVKLPVVALYDTQAIVVEDEKYRVAGTGPKEFFNGFKEKI